MISAGLLGDLLAEDSIAAYVAGLRKAYDIASSLVDGDNRAIDGTISQLHQELEREMIRVGAKVLP